MFAIVFRNNSSLTSIVSFLTMLLILAVACPTGNAQEDEFPGEADLNEAVDLNLVAETDREFDEIADLCESAIEKGLDEKGEALAKQIWASALLTYAKGHAERIFDGSAGPRWQIFRTRALNRLQRAVELQPDLIDAHQLIARLNLELPNGDEEMARKSVEKLADSPEPEQKAQALLLRASLAEDDNEAIGFLTKALEADPQNTRILRERGTRYLNLEAYDEAVADFIAIGDLEPDELMGYPAAIETLLKTEAEDRFERAQQLAEKMIEHDPANTLSYQLQSEIYSAQDQTDRAIEAMNRALEIDQADPDLYMRRANLHYDSKAYDKTLEDLEKVLEMRPSDFRALYLQSFTNLALENYDQAIEQMKVLRDGFRRMYSVDPSSLGTYLQFANDYAMFHMAAERSRQAIEIYDEILEEEPENLRALRGRGDAFLNIGDHANAIQNYKAALDLAPDDDGVLNNYSWVLSTSPDDEIRNGELALELAQKANQLTEGKQAHILSTLAAAYAETGDFDKARQWAQKAVELSEDEEQRKGLQEELDSYLADPPKPWRERESEGESEGEGEDDESQPSGDQEPNKQDEADDGDEKSDKSKDDKSKDDKSDDDKSDDDKSDDDKSDDDKSDDGESDDGESDDGEFVAIGLGTL